MSPATPCPQADPLAGIALLIPAWQPDETILTLAEELSAAGFGLLVVVDDGSDRDCLAIFDSLAARGLRVLRHGVNLGKGRALKTGFNCVLTEYAQVQAVITVDADGQHTVPDVKRVAEAWATGDGRAVLGVRTFGREVPLRSQLGNQLTRLIFSFVSGVRLRDTQTGLRVLPRGILPTLMKLDGERYEFEMTMLAHLCREAGRPVEIPIATVYLDGNRSSHFDPIRDSMRIYFVLARFYFSALVAAGVDFLGFSIAYSMTHHLLASVAIGRLSSLINFVMNRKWVFHNRGSVTAALWRYYVLVVAIAFLGYGALWVMLTRLHWNVFLSKILADTLLSLVSFSVQRTFIFRRKAEAGLAV